MKVFYFMLIIFTSNILLANFIMFFEKRRTPELEKTGLANTIELILSLILTCFIIGGTYYFIGNYKLLI